MSAATFPEIIASNTVVVFHVWAEWNLHDRKMDATLQELHPEYEERIAFYALNSDDPELWDIMRRSNVQNIPALLFFVDGSWRETVIGLYPEEELLARMNELLIVPISASEE